MTVPVVGHAADLQPDDRLAGGGALVHGSPPRAMALSVAIALVTVWAAIAASYTTNYPVGFFVGSLSAVWYALGRGWAAWRRRGGGAAVAAATGVHAPERHTILT